MQKFKMKVSIVSLFGEFNFGNRLQNYAAQEVLRSMGLQTQSIYIQSFKEKTKNILKLVCFNTPLRLFFYSSNRFLHFKRQQVFKKFNQEHITLKSYSSISKIDDADFFVVGSDQVWNPTHYNNVNVKKQFYFLAFTKPSKRVCFSPSIGLSEIPTQWKKFYKEKLMEFPSISVREKRGAQIIKELTGRDAEVLIDPTLMIDKECWLKIAKKPNNVDLDNKYVFNYFLGDIPNKAKLDGEKIAKDLKGYVYDIMDPINPNLYISGPSEFLYLIEHASVVQTDSFHACVFSFLFGKPFLLYAREGADVDMFSRMETLFSTFGLKRKFVDSGLKNDIYECDYTYGYNKLILEREKVIKFLKQSMNLMD